MAAGKTKTLIDIKMVDYKYPNGVYALKNVNVQIKKGDFVFVIGRTGSGKSTFIKMLYREVKPNKGHVILDGADIARLKDHNVYKIRRKIGVVFQDYRLLPKLTVYENVAFALEVVGEAPKNIRMKVLRALELVGLKHKTRSFPNELSGGEQQRVAIARAIVNNPNVLICDEATGNLDPEKSIEIMEILNNVNKKLGTTIIMATHDKAIVNKYKKRVLVMKNGEIVKDEEKGTYKDEDI